MRPINRVAVLGAGVMGATIAAHLAGAGLEVLMLDMVPKEPTAEEKDKGLGLDQQAVRNRFAAQALQNLMRIKPAPLYRPEYAQAIEIGNFDDDLHRLSSCDWVVEVVVELLPVKQDLLRRISTHLAPDAILSSNTSGLSINALAQALPEDLRRRFLATHFFNPPRYMRLMELVGCAETDPELLAEMASFIGKRLGKGIVHAKDTVNFIANRIGVFSIYLSIHHMMQLGLTVEEVDRISGPATCRPKSATFRTADLVGLDTLAHVAANSHTLLPDDEQRTMFAQPELLSRLIDRGHLGNKTKAGFYRKGEVEGKTQILFYDYQSDTYRPLVRPKFPSIQAVKQVDDPGQRLRQVLAAKDPGAEFAWRTLRDILLYAFNRIPEIAEDVVSIDSAMRWGFNWELGPFEMFDCIGVRNLVERATADGVAIPAGLADIECFYRHDEAGNRLFYDLGSGTYKPVPCQEGELRLEVLRRAGKVVESSSGCSLIDLDDGVFCLEFHAKMNAIGGDTLAMTHKAIARAEQEGIGLVIGNQGSAFSVGANLMLLAVAMAEGAFEDIDLVVRSFQRATMALKYARIPVVAAPFNLALGGGCEFCLHADAITAHAETYMGLVEIGVGLLPAGGGTKELCLRAIQLSQRFDTDVQPFIISFFRQIAMARVSRSADECFDLGYLRRGDTITMDSSRLIHDAKKRVQALAVNYRPPRPLTNLPAPGRGIAATIQSQLWNMEQGGFITPYEAEIATSIAQVICGGDVSAGTLINEDYLLALERERFLRLCGNRKTGERIQHMLKTGKPLRN